jgi:hypothetical protein
MEIREDAGFCTSDLPQIRHPERSALQMDRVTQRLVARSRRTSAVFILAARAFSITKARFGRTREALSLHSREFTLGRSSAS